MRILVCVLHRFQVKYSYTFAKIFCLKLSARVVKYFIKFTDNKSAVEHSDSLVDSQGM